MKKRINKELTLFFNEKYPFKIERNSVKKYKFRAVLGVGGNVGNVKMRFKQLFEFLNSHSNTKIVSTSPILENPPFGFLEQDKFLNAVILIETNYKPFKLLNFLQKLEHRFGRRRTFKDAPRTLDLDILFFSSNFKKIDQQIIINSNDLIIPHAHWSERVSVIIPLLYL